ncbi:MAG TPA: bacteriohemerythrin [Holophagaceae bacterium]|nr:bacteriohemerythrin [Holophagaceae bacterium]
MARIEWSPNWSVGDDLLDHEHQGLIALINRLSEVEGEVRAHPGIWRECLAEMVLYAENHFRHEEERMGQVAYPHLEAHRAGHLRFRKQLSLLAQEAEARGEDALPNLHAFLAAWLKNHVLEDDRRYVAYLTVNPD